MCLPLQIPTHLVLQVFAKSTQRDYLDILKTTWLAAIVENIKIYSNFQIKNNLKKAVSSVIVIKFTNMQ